MKATTSGTSATTDPRMCNPNARTPTPRITANWAMPIPTQGSALPSTISNDVAGLAGADPMSPSPARRRTRT